MDEHNHHKGNNENSKGDKPKDTKAADISNEKTADKQNNNTENINKEDAIPESFAGLNINDDDTDKNSDFTAALFQELQNEKKFDVSDSIVTNINNADLMLSYIINQGIDIPEKLVKSVVNCKYAYKKNRWTPDIEVEFNMAFKELTNLIKPVTVDSLASSMPSELKDGISDRIVKFFGRNKRNALSKRSARGYTLGTVICMIVLLFVQIYFYLGSTRLTNIEECGTKIDEKQNRLTELMIVQSSENENIAVNTEFERVQSDIMELDAKRKANIEMLEPWVHFVRFLTFNTTIRTDTIAMSSIEAHDANTAIVQEAKSYDLILGIYVLPLLYGIIGGFTFVLRELTQEIKNLTFSTGSDVKYLLRILLGAIAGLSVGLFWGDIENTDYGIASLSPMLLAFLGGYLVEYLLLFLEKLATSFFRKYDPETEHKEEKKAEPKPAPIKASDNSNNEVDNK